MSFVIRKGELADADSIAGLLREPGLFSRIQDEPEQVTKRRVKKHLALCLEDHSHSIYVAQESTGEVLGYAAVHWLPYLFLPGPEGYVSELFISQARRGQGIGSQLLRAVREEAQERGCARLMLVNMRDRESYQRQFYKKQGWMEREDAANFIYRLDA